MSEAPASPTDRSPRRWIGAGIAGLMAAGLLAAGLLAGGRAIWPPDERADERREEIRDERPPETPSAPEVASATSAPSERPVEDDEPVPETPPPTPPARVGACDDGEADPSVDRPTVSELVAVRAAELDDRVRHTLRSPGASESLRQGLLEALEPERQEHALSLIAGAPDRVVDGFDHLAAVVSVLAWQALTADDARRARELSRYAERAAPRDPLPLLVDALASEALGDPTGARTALAEAFALEPSEPAVALAYLRRVRDGVEVQAALAAAEAYVAEVPGDLQIARIRERLRMRRAAMSHGAVRRLRGVDLLAPDAVPTALTDRALDVTDRALTDAARLLGVPRREALAVFVYRTHAELVAATCAQAWAAAIYDGALHVDADRLAAEDEVALSLRHEALHAALHAAVLDGRSGGASLPTWLDEGLAQYFAGEEPRGARRSFELMVREHTFVPIASMNGQFMVIDDPRDAGLAYHQALAMVLYLVDRRGERGIAEAVAYLVGGGDPDALLDGLGVPIDGEALLAFLARHLRGASR